MSKGLLTFLTVVEILALVIILAIYLLVVAKQLRSIANTLSEVTWGARAVEKQLRAVDSNIGQMNQALEDIAVTLPQAVQKAERAGREGAPV
jgi:uncharacterized protein YoxC